MINLLPPEYRLHQRYNHINARLVRWLVAGVALVVSLFLVFSVSWLYTDQQIKNLNDSLATTEGQLRDQNLEKVMKQADEISQNVRVIDQVLRREVRFSDLIQEIGQAMPPGTILSSLTLKSVNGAIDLTAGAKDYPSAARIGVNLSDPKKKLFEKVDIVSINCSIIEGPYKCSVNFRALFTSNASTRFLNVAGDTQ